MTPQEKAMQLIIKFYKVETIQGVCYMTIHQAKECAKIAVNEIIENGFNPQLAYNFWQEVLTIID